VIYPDGLSSLNCDRNCLSLYPRYAPVIVTLFRESTLAGAPARAIKLARIVTVIKTQVCSSCRSQVLLKLLHQEGYGLSGNAATSQLAVANILKLVHYFEAQGLITV
jgi:hypothetical protein